MSEIVRRSIILILAIIAMQAYGQTKHGLVIGLGQYKDKSWGTIHGDKDVPLVQKMLTSYGYKDITTLVNKEATKFGITSSFENLSKKCKKGDVVYIHFSGHGQQITDLNGDEEDGFDEAWIPYDAMYAYSKSYKGENHLIDDEIAKYLNIIKGKIGASGKILLVVDACHSGDSDRGSEDEEEYIRGASDDFVIPMERTPKRIAQIKENWMTLTACKNVQNNCEVKIRNGEFYGILTYALYSQSANLKTADNQKILNNLQQYVNLNRKRGHQTVTLSGDHSLAQFFK